MAFMVLWPITVPCSSPERHTKLNQWTNGLCLWVNMKERKVQALLERNKSKIYKKPRSHAALLSGLLICGNCGDYMRPKASQRVNTKGEVIYTYMCSTKERGRCRVCNMKNCNGNILDADVTEQLKLLSEDGSEFFRQLERSKRVLMGNRQEYDEEINQLKNKIS